MYGVVPRSLARSFGEVALTKCHICVCAVCVSFWADGEFRVNGLAPLLFAPIVMTAPVASPHLLDLRDFLSVPSSLPYL